MARIAPIPNERMTAVQRGLRDRIVAQGRRAHTGPFAALLHVPEVADDVDTLVKYFHSQTRVPAKLKELAILAIARAYTAQYEWFAHEPRARAAGLDGAIVEAIRARKRPEFRDPVEALVYDLTTEILDRRTLGDGHYACAVEALGEAAVVELIALIGVYIAIAVVLVSYQVEAPDGAPSPLPG
jgi:4-carboxymuconolactone decarboxylase